MPHSDRVFESTKRGSLQGPVPVARHEGYKTHCVRAKSRIKGESEFHYLRFSWDIEGVEHGYTQALEKGADAPASPIRKLTELGTGRGRARHKSALYEYRSARHPNAHSHA